MKMNINRKSLFIIVLFAILHGLCCICCRSLEIDDTRALTLLTIAMIFILAYQRRLKPYFILAAVIIAIVVAYLMGSALPLVLVPLFGESMWINALSTIFTTAVLGLLFELSTDLVLKVSGNEASFKEVPRRKEYRQRWVVRINDRIVPVTTDRIAYFYSESKYNYLVTSDGMKYIVDTTMDSIESNVDPESFFRINRSCILSRECIDSAVVSAGRYNVRIVPPADAPTLVARSHVKDFIQWLE